MNRVLFSSQSVHWPTPEALYRELDKEFHFDFDPCPLGESEADGSAPLFTPWVGKRIFCNPPYNCGIARFLERACESSVSVFLLPARTDTKWFHNIVLPNAREIRFIKGRLRFGDVKDYAPFPSMLAIFSKE
jgi:DNA N-6-adenine-methyltransferase (Dam)